MTVIDCGAMASLVKASNYIIISLQIQQLLFPPDINECLEAAMSSRALCNQTQVCVNQPGGFQCQCPGGSELNPQGVCEVPIPPPPTTTPAPTPTPPSGKPDVAGDALLASSYHY